MNKTIKFLVSKENNGERLDWYLSRQISELTRSFIQKLIKKKLIKINENFNCSPSTKIKSNDTIIINIIENEENTLIPKRIDLKIIYEDNDILVIDKPKGLVVHPGAGNHNNTLANALAFKYKNSLSNIGGNLRPGIVHRIDKETSGLLVIAKNNISHSKLSKQFSDHSIKRKYQCLAWGVIRPMSGRIETLISRNKNNRQLMMVNQFIGKKAITNYETIRVFTIKNIPKISFLECQLETGRTHQIRVHLKHMGVSLLGDKKYGKKNTKFKKINEKFQKVFENLNGQALHAKTLEFIHPKKNKIVSFNSNLPSDFTKLLNLLEKLSS